MDGITPEVVNAYFTPLDYILYLMAVLVIVFIYYRYQWWRKCKDYIKVIVVKSDGSSDVKYVKKEGNCVTLVNPDTGSAKLWAVTKLSTFDTLYPGDGFIPVILQEKIRTTVVDETDWEPLINRGDYSENVASPDVIERLKKVAENAPDDIKTALETLTGKLTTASTRAMIADPSFIGNLFMTKVAEMAATVFREFEDRLKSLSSKFDQMINPVVTYIMIGLTIIGIIAVIFLVVPAVGDMQGDVEAIKKALGVP